MTTETANENKDALIALMQAQIDQFPEAGRYDARNICACIAWRHELRESKTLEVAKARSEYASKPATEIIAVLQPLAEHYRDFGTQEIHSRDNSKQNLSSALQKAGDGPSVADLKVAEFETLAEQVFSRDILKEEEKIVQRA